MTIIIPEERQIEEDIILSRIRRGEKVEHFETVRRRKDGSFIDVSVTVSPVKNAEGTIIGASKVARDITDRLAAETLTEHLAAIIQSSDDAIVSKDLNGIVKSWNRGAERLFGYLQEEMIGKPILILLPDDRKDEETSILSRIRRGERVDHFETIRRRKDGQLIHVSATISPIRDRNGRVIGASKVARDISERKIFEATTAAFTQELERHVRQRTAELENANREMESFTYSIAHDIRAPLRAIVATSKMVLEDFGAIMPEAGRSMLERQVVSSNYLARLVDDLLTYSRLGKIPPKVVRVDLSALARQVAQDIGSPDHRFAIEDRLFVEGDAAMLHLLIQNLLDNAVKFSPHGGEIEVGRSGTTFYVRDHGLGFDMAYAEKIFVPFERLVRNDEISGTGIGLANVKRIVEKHGGSIWASSVIEEGTTIYFTLPNPPHHAGIPADDRQRSETESGLSNFDPIGEKNLSY
jgi:PAS domain S-box-containing protein